MAIVYASGNDGPQYGWRKAIALEFNKDKQPPRSFRADETFAPGELQPQVSPVARLKRTNSNRNLGTTTSRNHLFCWFANTAILMAIVESDSDSDSGPSTSRPTSHLTSTTALLSSLYIPSEYGRSDSMETATAADVLDKLRQWKVKALFGLKGLKEQAEQLRSKSCESAGRDILNGEGHTSYVKEGEGVRWGEGIGDEDVVWRVARFRGRDGEWADEQMSEIAEGIVFCFRFLIGLCA